MPDGNLNYTGDQASVLPDNTPAILHFSQLFAEQARQKQMQQAAQAKADQERRLRVQTYLGNRLNSKDFETSSDYQGIINKGLQDINDKANQELNSGIPEDQVMAHINDNLMQTKANAERVNEGDKNITASLADLAKRNPGLDMAAIGSIAKHDMHYKKDENGNYVQKDFSEIDPTQNYVADAYHNHYENAFPTDVQNSAIPRLFDQQKLQDVSEQPTYDANHNLVTPGYKGKLPSLVTIKKDANGKTIYQNGQPVIDIPGSSNYRIPGQQTDYVDENGKTVPVVSDQVYKQAYGGAVGSAIEKQVKDQINKANEVAGTNIELDSPYADMLRKNLLYQNLKGEATSRFKFETPKDESATLKNQAFSQGMRTAHLNLSEHNSQRADRALSDKEKGVFPVGTDGKPIKSYYDNLLSKKQSFFNPLTGTSQEYIDVSHEDPGQLVNLIGGKINTHGHILGGVQPININGNKYLQVTKDADGNDVIANDNTTIDRDEANLRQIKALPAKNKLPLVPAPKKTIIQKAKDLFTPKKIKGSDEKLY